MIKIIAIIALSLSVIGILYSIGALFMIRIRMYFLGFNINKHPDLLKMLDDALTYICKSENLPVFNRTFYEMNKDEVNESEKSLGLYISFKSTESQKELDDIRRTIQEIEDKYRMKYATICMLRGVEPIDERRLFIPRIELAEDELLRMGGTCSYYQTWFHEAGHHMAHKELGEDGGGEANAELYAAKLIKHYLPSYFQLIGRFYIRFEDYAPKLTNKEKFFAYINFLLYLIHNSKTNGTKIYNKR